MLLISGRGCGFPGVHAWEWLRMRFAIVSDIHANLQAWNAVLLDIRSQAVDRIICLGDVVGYGPNPAEVLQSVHENVDQLVLGNHDAAVCGRMGTELFNDTARELIEWTGRQLNQQACHFLEQLPLMLHADRFKCVHGDFSEPAAYHYVIDPVDAEPSWQAAEQQLLFAGHTHRPGIFLLGNSGTPHLVAPQDFVCEDSKRYLVNVGSVGQPRDGDARACYCIFDDDAGSVMWRRIPFDLDAYRAALSEKAVPESASYFLRHDPRAATPPLREILSFSPAESLEQCAEDTVEEQEISVLQKRISRWKGVATAVLGVFIVIGMILGILFWRSSTREQTLVGLSPGTIAVRRASEDRNVLIMPEAVTPVNTPVGGWNIKLGDHRKQAVCVMSLESEGHAFKLASQHIHCPLVLQGPVVDVAPDMRFRLEALFKLSEDFDGTITTFIDLARQKDGQSSQEPDFGGKTPNLPRKGGWFLAKETFDIPANGAEICIGIKGAFIGTVLIKDIQLIRTR